MGRAQRRSLSWMRRHRPARGRPEGFTLLECVIALAVIGVATSVVVSMYLASNRLGKDNLDARVAMALAQERVADIRQYPEQYDWPQVQEGETARLIPLPDSGPGVNFSPPSFLPIERRAGLREKNQYEQYTWQAYVQAPENTDGYIHLVVVVLWVSEGRERNFTLTTCLPVALTGGVT